MSVEERVAQLETDVEVLKSRVAHIDETVHEIATDTKAIRSVLDRRSGLLTILGGACVLSVPALVAWLLAKHI